MFSKKGMMHQASSMDLVIILIGVIIGIALVWYGLKQGWSFFTALCPATAAVAP